MSLLNFQAEAGASTSYVLSYLNLANRRLWRLAICFQYRCVVFTPSRLDILRISTLRLQERVSLFARNVITSGEGFDWEYLGSILSNFEMMHSIKYTLSYQLKQ